jgi:hypothetical protein
MSEPNWADMGLSWTTETVSRQNGANKADRVAYSTPAQIPFVTDLASYPKFVEHFGEATVLSFINASNSIRVRAQAVNRAALETNAKCGAAELRLKVYNTMRGIRAAMAPMIVVKNVRTLPDGTTYDGTDIAEYRDMYAAALVVAGVDATIAATIAGTQSF